MIILRTSSNHVMSPCQQEVVPSYLATSPIRSVGEELMESQLGRGSSHHHGKLRSIKKEKKEVLDWWDCINAALSYHIDTVPCTSLPVQSLGPQNGDGGTTKKRRKRRRKTRPEGLGAGGGVGGRREESVDEFSEDEDMFTIDLSSDEEKDRDSSRCVSACVREKEVVIYQSTLTVSEENKPRQQSQCCLWGSRTVASNNCDCV